MDFLPLGFSPYVALVADPILVLQHFNEKLRSHKPDSWVFDSSVHMSKYNPDKLRVSVTRGERTKEESHVG